LNPSNGLSIRRTPEILVEQRCNYLLRKKGVQTGRAIAQAKPSFYLTALLKKINSCCLLGKLSKEKIT